MEKGNINISTAHELSRLDNEGQAKAYQQYEEKGEMHIKDVKQEQKEEITDEQAEQAQKAIIDAIKGEANRDIFKAKDTPEGIEKMLRKHFEKTFKGSKINLEDGGHFIYRFQAEGLTIINEEWQNYVIEYADLAEIVGLMIESGDLVYDDTPEEVQEERENTEEDAGGAFSGMNESQAAGGMEEEDNEPLPGQQDMSDYPEYVPDPEEKGLSFTEWIQKKYGTGQYNLIQKVVRDTILSQAEGNNNTCLKECESRLTNALSVWVMGKTKEYQTYLQS